MGNENQDRGLMGDVVDRMFDVGNKRKVERPLKYRWNIWFIRNVDYATTTALLRAAAALGIDSLCRLCLTKLNGDDSGVAQLFGHLNTIHDIMVADIGRWRPFLDIDEVHVWIEEAIGHFKESITFGQVMGDAHLRNKTVQWQVKVTVLDKKDSERLKERQIYSNLGLFDAVTVIEDNTHNSKDGTDGKDRKDLMELFFDTDQLKLEVKLVDVVDIGTEDDIMISKISCWMHFWSTNDH